jgi:hypothetical protein
VGGLPPPLIAVSLSGVTRFSIRGRNSRMIVSASQPPFRPEVSIGRGCWKIDRL